MKTSLEIQVLQLFERALAQPADGRTAWLAGQGQSDEVVARVMRLLDAERAASGFMEETAVMPEEVPPECGVMQWEADDRLAVLRPAPRRTVERLPFHVWMALARATPLPPPEDEQGDLAVAD